MKYDKRKIKRGHRFLLQFVKTYPREMLKYYNGMHILSLARSILNGEQRGTYLFLINVDISSQFVELE